MRILQSKGLGDPEKSDELSAKEIKQILDHSYIEINSNESLTHLECRQDGDLELILHKEKNNQGGAFLETNMKNQVHDIFLYPLIHLGNWFKNTPMGYTKLRKIINDIAANTGINLDNGRKITNCSCHCTAIQMLKNNELSDSDLQIKTIIIGILVYDSIPLFKTPVSSISSPVVNVARVPNIGHFMN
ncbi:11524_t:CDS:2 [Funneliformis caledonium]|uniref:11524_t:CDS:1 n=1 Tax=Funneliformis caledonium TaxID=1117310 RepID=A0A9N9GYU2_9GLOM|nr:11524_t:CDS:2 [Funneliformis caledonium]